jgi:molybdenum cofactor cytidylyltransferase
MVAGIVLGAGSSTRLGRPKQLLPFGETCLLGRVVQDVSASSLAEVVLVVGREAATVLAALPPSRARAVSNEAYGLGCASSLLAGLDAMDPQADGLLLLLGDMPGVDATVIDPVLATVGAIRPWAAVTSYRDGIGHPFYFSAATFPELRSLHGDKAVWKIVDREPADRVVRIAVDAARPQDVDTWEDYLAVCARFGVTPGRVASR